MVIRDKASSGSTSTSVHTFFLLSAKVQISQTRSEDGNVTLRVRASTRPAFDTAVAGLDKARKFYAGMALWHLSSSEISAQEMAAIADPAQVLVMTAASLVQKSPAAVSAFDDAYAKVADELASYKAFLQRAQTDVSLDEETKESLTSFSEMVNNYCNDIESLCTRLHDTEADHCTGSISLGDLSAGLLDLVEGTLRPQYRRCVRKVVRQGPDTTATKRNQIVDESRPVQPTMSLPKLDKALYTALKRGDGTEAANCWNGVQTPPICAFCVAFAFDRASPWPTKASNCRGSCTHSVVTTPTLKSQRNLQDSKKRVSGWGTACDRLVRPASSLHPVCPCFQGRYRLVHATQRNGPTRSSAC
jgi:hypothetical protein